MASAGAAVLWLLLAMPAQAQAAPCTFILGFATLVQLVPQAGGCLDNQAFAANGDAQQHSSGGLLVWRKADNWTAFTDGYRTWVNGPNGIQARLNTERFSWEVPATANSTPVVASASSSSGSTCLNGACFNADGSFLAFLQDISRTSLGKDLLASTAGTTLRFTNVPAESLGDYRPASDLVEIASWLPGSGEFEAAAVLAHELTHARQGRAGKLAKGQQCYVDEVEAFTVSGQVWKELWGSQLPGDTTTVRAELNILARVSLRPQDLYQAYAKECGPPS